MNMKMNFLDFHFISFFVSFHYVQFSSMTFPYMYMYILLYHFTFCSTSIDVYNTPIMKSKTFDVKCYFVHSKSRNLFISAITFQIVVLTCSCTLFVAILVTSLFRLFLSFKFEFMIFLSLLFFIFLAFDRNSCITMSWSHMVISKIIPLTSKHILHE